MRISGTKPDATGRSSGKVPGARGRRMRPPAGVPWIWHTRELIESPAWRMRTINCVRLIEFLECDHMNHAGTENGALKAQYDQLVRWGVGRSHIKPAIEEAQALGLLVIERGGGRWAGTNQAALYRLTYLPDHNGNAPTDDWKAVTVPAARQDRAKATAARLTTQQNRFPSPYLGTTVVPIQGLPNARRRVGKL